MLLPVRNSGKSSTFAPVNNDIRQNQCNTTYPVHANIISSCLGPWGWAIYRTTYTPESDRLWPQAIDTIKAYLAHYTRRAFKRDEGLYEAAMTGLDNTPIQDFSLDQATLDDLRLHFASWCQSQDHSDWMDARFTTFLVVDQVALDKIARAPQPDDPKARARDRLEPYVLVVSAQHEAGRRLPSLTSARSGVPVQEGKVFPGYMKVSLSYLQELWEAVAEYRDVYDICPSAFDEVPEWLP